MTTLAGLLADPPRVVEPPELNCLRDDVAVQTCALPASAREEQIHALVQQLFFQHEPRVRHVGFAAIDPANETAPLCLDVASALAKCSTQDVGLVDARVQSVALHAQLDIEPADSLETAWSIAPHLWLVPRRNWLDETPALSMRGPSLSRLRAATMEFDYSVVSLDPASWMTAGISQICDGLVLVLAANRTRRLVASQTLQQLKRARVRVLGIVLAERRFPVPEGLYRHL